MSNRNFDSDNHRGFASMDPEKKRTLVNKGGYPSHQSKQSEERELEESTAVRGFAAMDEKKRKQVAKLGGSTSRRNRIDWKNQGPIL